MGRSWQARGYPGPARFARTDEWRDNKLSGGNWGDTVMLIMWILGGLAAVVVLFLLAGWVVQRYGPDAQARRAREQFLRERPRLEQEFFQAAAASGKPRGLRWKNCQWGPQSEFVRERRTFQLLALVGVTIQFEAVEGSDMEGLPAVGNLRNASAVFIYQQGQWHTTGKAVFNLNPDEAIEHFAGQYKRQRFPDPEPPV